MPGSLRPVATARHSFPLTRSAGTAKCPLGDSSPDRRIGGGVEMGGPGSGRRRDYRKRGLAEYCVALGIDDLVRDGLDPTLECSGSISLPNPGGGPGNGLLVEYRLDLSFGEPILFYSLQDGGAGQVRLQKTIHYRGG